ncbi:MAG: 8-oxoguanine DNA glycosylase [Clostridia bacterium]|nr:8-oxoguanine DNA glycosylase [Clostridia bacterium]
MITRIIDNCNLKQIAESGQAFRWKQLDETGNKYSIIAYGDYVEVEQQGNVFTFNCGETGYMTIWDWYFDTQTDYAQIIASTDPQDELMQAAIRSGSGIRILQQDIWETFITFIISQNNRIGRIRNTIEKMCERYGEQRCHTTLDIRADSIEFKADGTKKYYTFPRPEALSNVDNLQGLGLGYRDKYIAAAAKAVQNHVLELKQLRFMEHEQALEVLKQVMGIGDKVAECICLFGLHQLQAYPVDTWVKKIEKYYGSGYIEKHYNGYQGVIQQYLFSYARLHGLPEREGQSEKKKETTGNAKKDG